MDLFHQEEHGPFGTDYGLERPTIEARVFFRPTTPSTGPGLEGRRLGLEWRYGTHARVFFRPTTPTSSGLD